jgi:hypothetical protein
MACFAANCANPYLSRQVSIVFAPSTGCNVARRAKRGACLAMSVVASKATGRSTSVLLLSAHSPPSRIIRAPIRCPQDAGERLHSPSRIKTEVDAVDFISSRNNHPALCQNCRIDTSTEILLYAYFMGPLEGERILAPICRISTRYWRHCGRAARIRFCRKVWGVRDARATIVQAVLQSLDRVEMSFGRRSASSTGALSS